MRIYLVTSSILIFLSACNNADTESDTVPVFQPDKTLVRNDIPAAENDTPVFDAANPTFINTGNVTPEEVVNFAETLKGVPYKYACTDPSQGFDCSGFITYVFNHFKIPVPRSSVDFTNVQQEVPLEDAKRGDIILFTGTDSTIRVVGHMGIVTSNSGEGLEFIHSTSGKAYGVTTTPLNDYYQGRFVKVLRIFNQNDIR